MINWSNVPTDAVHAAVASIFELSNSNDLGPSELYIACKMIAHFLEKQYGCVWIDEEKFIEQLSDFKAR